MNGACKRVFFHLSRATAAVTCFEDPGFFRVIVVFPLFVPVAYRVSGRHLIRRPHAEQVLAKRIVRLVHELVVFGQRLCPRQRVPAQLITQHMQNENTNFYKRTYSVHLYEKS